MNWYLVVMMILLVLSMVTHVYRIGVPDWKRPSTLASAIDLAMHVALFCWSFGLWLKA